MKIVIGGKTVEVSNEEITKAIEDQKESIEVNSTDLVIRDKTEEETFVSNLKNEAKTAGIEIAVKETRNQLGLDFKGRTIDVLLDAYKTKILEEAKIEPAEQVKTLTKDLETLKTTISTLETEKNTIKTQFDGFKNETVLNSTLSSLIPSNTILPKDDMLMIVRNKIKLGVDESGSVVSFNPDGTPRKDDKTLNPVPVNQVIQEFFDQNPSYLKDVEGGKGGSDTGGGTGGKMTIEKYIEQAEKDGKAVGSVEFNNELNEKIKAGLIQV